MSKHGGRLKVLVVSHTYPHPADTTYGIFVEEEVRELSKRCQLKVISPTPWFLPLKICRKWYAYTRIPLRATRDGIEVFYTRTLIFPKNFAFSLLGCTFFLSVLKCARAIEKGFHFDLIHGHIAYPDGLAAVMVGRALDRPVVITLHGTDVNVYFKHRLWRELGLLALSKADQVIAVGDGLRRTVIEGYGADRDKISVVPNGVDSNRFVPIPRDEAAKRLELENEGSRVLYVGRISKSKGIDHLLQAARGLAETGDRLVELFLVGGGEYEQQAKLLAERLDITHMAHFAGKRPNCEIPLWMNACDVLVLPSLSEGFGVVLIEAMACGKPVVATRCGGPEDIVNPDTGILVPQGDEVALAKALREVLSGKHKFDPQKIRQHIIDNYGYDGIASRILDVYRQVLRG